MMAPKIRGFTSLSIGWPNQIPIKKENNMTVPPITEIGLVCTFLKLGRSTKSNFFDTAMIMGVIIKLTIMVNAMSSKVYISSPSLNKLINFLKFLV